MTDDDEATGDDVQALAALGDRSRRALYGYVTSSGRAVSRDEAAEAVGLERGTAAHHLDRLAADGLLEVEYRRLTGRQGPGAGRPAKLYRRAHRQFTVNLPPRDYEFAGRLLAAAADRARAENLDISTALDATCTRAGAEIASSIERNLRRNAGVRARREGLLRALADFGYEPSTEPDGTVVLGNCPFHELSAEHTELVCGMNHCVLSSAADALDAGLSARLEPDAPRCCVRFAPRPPAHTSGTPRNRSDQR